MSKTLIIGAGMAGLTAAYYLQKAGKEVTVLDKGRGVGGRMNSRSIDKVYRFDHGAPSFLAHNVDFQEFLASLAQENTVYHWPQKGEWAGRGGMNSLPKFLARNIEVHTQQKVLRMMATDAGIHICTETNQHYQADRLIITCPVSQAVELLANSGFVLNPEVLAILAAISYTPAFAIMCTLNGEWQGEAPTNLQALGIASWVENKAKGISEQPCLTLQTTAEFSQMHLEEEPKAVAQGLLNTLEKVLPPSQIGKVEAHRWRYAQVQSPYHEPFLRFDLPFDCCIGGDAFGQGGVEGAYLSGRAMAELG